MLAEIENARQIAGEERRRWFRDDDLDLIVWFNDANVISGFQLCYDKFHHERALTWREGDSYQHHGIDGGDVAGGSSMTPILVADGTFDKEHISSVFAQKSAHMDPAIASFVLEKVRDFPGR